MTLAGRIRADKYQFLLFAILVVIVFGLFRRTPGWGWDDGFYWGQLTSIWFDGDLTLHDDLLANFNGVEAQHRAITWLRSDGSLHNDFAIGTALVDGLYAGPVVLVNRWLGEPRMTEMLVTVVVVGTLFKLWILVFSLLALLESFVQTTRWRHLSVACTFFATPIVYYTIDFYWMVHLNSGIFTTLFVLGALCFVRRPSRGSSLAVGLTGALMILTRWQNAVFALLLVPPLVHRFVACSDLQRKAYWRFIAMALAVVVVSTSIQLLAWHRQFGRFLVLPQGSDFMRWGSPALGPTLLSGYHGLLPWSPVYGLAVVGLLIGFHRQRGTPRWFMLGALLVVAATTYVNACVEDWWAGSSYGARRFSGLVPLVAIGTGQLLGALRVRSAAAVGCLVLLWAYVTFTSYRCYIDDLSVPFRGYPSVHNRAESPEWITDASEARRVLWRKIRAPHYRALDILPGPRRLVNQVFSLAVLLASLLMTARLMTTCRSNALLRARLVVSGSVYLLIFAIVMAVRIPRSDPLNPLWLGRLTGTVSSDEAMEGGVPAAPLRFVDALDEIRHENYEGARMLLEGADRKEYRNLELEKIVGLARALRFDGESARGAGLRPRAPGHSAPRPPETRPLPASPPRP